MARLKIGLTGGIASGKSVAAEVFARLGASIVDADIVSREVGQKEIALNFPQCVTAGVLDRRKLREYVFSSPQELRKLNAITHPLILTRITETVDKTDGVAVIVAPLLCESGLYKFCDVNICITASADRRISRLKKRDNIDDELAYNMIAAQMSDNDKIALCDYVICNDGSKEELEDKIEKWWREKAQTPDI